MCAMRHHGSGQAASETFAVQVPSPPSSAVLACACVCASADRVESVRVGGRCKVWKCGATHLIGF